MLMWGLVCVTLTQANQSPIPVQRAGQLDQPQVVAVLLSYRTKIPRTSDSTRRSAPPPNDAAYDGLLSPGFTSSLPLWMSGCTSPSSPLPGRGLS